MTEPAQIRLNIAPELRDEFKAACLRSGVSMADQAARLIAQFMAPQETPSGPDPEPQAAADAAPQDQVSGAVADPPPSLDERLDAILESLESTASRGNVHWLSETLLRDAAQRHASLGKHLEEDIEASHRRWQAIVAVRLRDRYWLGAAALAGMATLGLLLALVSGTALGRMLAVNLAGGDTPWQAALLLSGDGSPLRAGLMAETRALLDGPEFRESYGDCIDRALRSKRPVTCKLTLPPLAPAR